uniref:Uncharacterized protein n=1 Tax=Pristionchus pacificus TaxID=54126 RepID=A0A2A6CXF9_PRIPA|eukprot:PDM82711.1 hypothetical protein PRIPAC_37104 [Pristionchus pacificus]
MAELAAANKERIRRGYGARAEGTMELVMGNWAVNKKVAVQVALFILHCLSPVREERNFAEDEGKAHPKELQCNDATSYGSPGMGNVQGKKREFGPEALCEIAATRAKIERNLFVVMTRVNRVMGSRLVTGTPMQIICRRQGILYDLSVRQPFSGAPNQINGVMVR